MAPRQDAIDINDFVFAATGARVRRLTLADGTHWFPAVDVATDLGYANTRDALRHGVAQQHTTSLGELARTVDQIDGSCKFAAHGLKKHMKLVNLRGLVQLVNGCMKPESQPFKAWVSDVIATIQRDGSYALDRAPVQPAPTGGTAYAMPQQVADAIVRLEERNIRTDEMFTAFQREQNDLLRQINRSQSVMADALQDIAASLKRPDVHSDGSGAAPEPKLTARDLLATWKAKNLVVTEDVHSVAACLAPALVRGEASYRLEEIATRTGLSQERVNDCLRMLLKRGCVRRRGCTPDGAPVYVLP
ncbi:Bro-N domain-containing protein [Streptomyces torulosus]|uniref:BRO-N domain-containing protein n=1 Tax=Streptomyces torulosus TaxID=68276 RepID=UPI001F0AD5AD|nr:Bro-N domain-containing protein [Streptomyces torulosus]